MRPLRWTDELQLYILTGLIGLGLFSELDRLTPVYGVFVLILLIALERTKAARPASRPRSKVLSNESPPAATSEATARTWDRNSILIAVIVLLPTLLLWLSRLGREFPFSGDHDHHVFASSAALVFWKSAFWLPILWTMILFFVYRKRKIAEFAGAGALVALAIVGLGYQVPQFYFARYPAFGYLLTAPFVSLANFFKLPDLIWANQLVQMLSLPLWLLILRPWILNRRPDFRALLVGLFLFWQKDFLHYQVSAYLEPWSLIFILLGAEMAISTDLPRYRSILMIGIATWFKETSVLLMPFFWAGLYLPNWHKIDRKEALLTGVAAATPFIGYYLLRIQENIWREAGVNDWEQVFSGSRLHELGHFIFSQWGNGGILLLLLATLAFGLMARCGKKRGLAIALGLSIIFIFVFYFIDKISQDYTGYSRFHLPAYAILGGGFFWLVAQLSVQRVILLAVVIAVLQLTNLAGFLKLSFGPAPEQSYNEYHNSPIYFPIRALIAGAERDAKIRAGDNILVISPIPNLYPQSLAAGYRDLLSQYRFAVTTLDTNHCACASDRKGVLGLFTTQVGLKLHTPSDNKTRLSMQACVEQITRSCQTTREFRQSDGQLAGILGLSGT